MAANGYNFRYLTASIQIFGSQIYIIYNLPNVFRGCNPKMLYLSKSKILGSAAS